MALVPRRVCWLAPAEWSFVALARAVEYMPRTSLERNAVADGVIFTLVDTNHCFGAKMEIDWLVTTKKRAAFTAYDRRVPHYNFPI